MEPISIIQQPGVSIKPKLTHDDVVKVLREVYALECLSIKDLNGYDDNNYHVKVSASSSNKYLKEPNASGYVLKVINTLDSQKPSLIEAQTGVLLHLARENLRCPVPVQTQTGQYFTLATFPSGTHIVRLLEFIEGKILHQVPILSKFLFYQCGRFLAQLDDKFKSFHHPAYDRHKSLWMLDQVPELNRYIFAVTDSKKVKLVQGVIDEFQERVVPALEGLDKGMIHGDFNEQNILLEEFDGTSLKDRWQIKAILDFGDTQYSPYLFELAIALTYMMFQAKNLDSGGYFLAGYRSVRTLPKAEEDLLKVCIAARLCQSLVLGAYSSLQDPGNAYILTTATVGWQLLEEICSVSREELHQKWDACSVVV